MTGKGEGKGVTATPQYRTHHAVAARDQDEALKVKVGSGARHPCLLNASCTRRAKQQSSPKLAQVVHASHHRAEDTHAHAHGHAKRTLAMTPFHVPSFMYHTKPPMPPANSVMGTASRPVLTLPGKRQVCGGGGHKATSVVNQQRQRRLQQHT